MDLTATGLGDLFKECTALVFVDGRPTGTAFFITDRQLLTCAHVVGASEELEVQPFNRPRRAAQLVHPPDTAADLALLQVAPEPNEAPQPAVLLDRRLVSGDHQVAGYPREEGYTAGLESFAVTAHPRDDPGANQPQMLQLEGGRMITWGLSGGPVLSVSRGAVTAVVRSSKDPTAITGGGAIPIDAAARAFVEVEHLASVPPPATRRWRDEIGPERWKALDKGWDLRSRVDLRVSGKRKRWRIGLDTAAESTQEITVNDLGDDVAEAIFGWAQRQRIRRSEEVELLGRLLAGALFPTGVADHLRSLEGADEILVRLHIDPAGDLADIPWELATVPGQRRRFLAADPGFRLVRVVDGPPTESLSPGKEASVLAVVVQPSLWRFPVVYVGKELEWPSLDRICGPLRDAVEGRGFKLDLRENPQPSEVSNLLETRQYDVVHYVGVGRLSRQDEPEICFVDYEKESPVWQSATMLLERAAASGAKLVVLELMLPPVSFDDDPITPSSLAPFIEGQALAVVLTRFPVHPSQFLQFNLDLYQALKTPLSIEAAVQVGRRNLERNKPLGDALCFGWFTLLTTSKNESFIVAKPTNEPTRFESRQLGESPGRTDGQGGRPEGGVVRDGFDR